MLNLFFYSNPLTLYMATFHLMHNMFCMQLCPRSSHTEDTIVSSHFPLPLLEGENRGFSLLQHTLESLHNYTKNSTHLILCSHWHAKPCSATVNTASLYTDKMHEDIRPWDTRRENGISGQCCFWLIIKL